ncbi:hypothetical protein ACSTIG_23510, partial [Vibrio parahaemolyticus]
LEAAIREKPDFAEALATLGWLLVRKEQSATYPEQAEDDSEALRVIAQALALTPRDPMALAARGRYLA